MWLCSAQFVKAKSCESVWPHVVMCVLVCKINIFHFYRVKKSPYHLEDGITEAKVQVVHGVHSLCVSFFKTLLNPLLCLSIQNNFEMV